MHKFVAFLLITYCLSCSKQSSSSFQMPISPIINKDTTFSLGADVSWVTEMENSNIKFYDRSGNATDCIGILKGLGMNSIRLRTWVNPTNGYCDLNDLIIKAKRANALGMRILIDFHYSDSWADPGSQTKPAKWMNEDINVLQLSLYNYTTNVLNNLKSNGIQPSWIQLGNETNDGMLWPEGKASVSMSNFATLIKSGYKAVKDIFPEAKVVVHISNGYDNILYRWIFDGLKSNGAKWDVIGMSLYPTASNWQILNNQCLLNMNDMLIRYDKEIMICEVGMAVSDSIASNLFLKDLISKVKGIKSNKGLGIFYWEPEAYNNWKGYKLGAFNNLGQPDAALIGLE